MAKCEIIDCPYDSFGNSSECVLHLEKSNYHSDSKDGILKPFFSTLIKEIAESAFQHQEQTHLVNIETLSRYLSNGEFFVNDNVKFANLKSFPYALHYYISEEPLTNIVKIIGVYSTKTKRTSSII